MTLLYLNTQGSTLRVRAGRFRVTQGQQILLEVPQHTVEDVLLLGGVQVTTQAMRVLLEQDTPLHLLTLGGRYLGRLEPDRGDQVELLRAQVYAGDDPRFRLEVAKSVVRAKLLGSSALLKRYECNTALREHHQIVSKLEGVQSVDALRGFEGLAASHYFAALSDLLPEKWNFRGRVRRPPTDPVNALLSFGYSLLHARVLTALRVAGLHSALGFLHVSHGTRPALALDLIEEFRAAVVDRMVLDLVMHRRIDPLEFIPTPEGMMLGEGARANFLGHFEAAMRRTSTRGHTFQSQVLHQARLLAEAIRNRSTYPAYTWQ
jgi:CRISP-associated protein Cas1